MEKYTALVLSFVLVFQPCFSSLRCDKNTRKRILERFHNCTTHYKSEYKEEIKKEDFDVEIATCKLVDNVVNDCGDIWRECHEEVEVVEMKKHQVNTLVEKNKNALSLMKKCKSIKKYR